MNFNLDFWRLIIQFSIAKSGLWSKGNDVYLVHIGILKSGNKRMLKIVLLPFSLMIGFN